MITYRTKGQTRWKSGAQSYRG